MDTVCAISTPPGTGGIAVVRVSGPRAVAACDSVWRGKPLRHCGSHTAHLGEIVDPGGGVVDQAVATLFLAPRSYTGEDVVELSLHGSPWVQSETLRLLVDAGCRLAQPGEFTRRAFLAGRMDLAQAEAAADLIAARTRAQARAAHSQMRGDFSRELAGLRRQLLDLASLLELELDFSDQDVEFADRALLSSTAGRALAEVRRLAGTFKLGRALREGIPVAIVGKPNAGKSTLLNALVRDDRAIVSDIPGTTRDTVEDTAEIGGRLYRFIDTAGLRDAADAVERMGVARTLQAASRADVVLLLTTPQDGPEEKERLRRDVDAVRHADSVVVELLNKVDTLVPGDTPPAGVAPICAREGEAARQTVAEALRSAARVGDVSDGDTVVTNLRHYEALTHAADALARVLRGLDSGLESDLVAQDLREGLSALSEITGAVTTPEILQNIFARFCVGK